MVPSFYPYKIVSKHQNGHGNLEVVMSFYCPHKDENKADIRFLAVFEKVSGYNLHQVMFFQARHKKEKNRKFTVVPNNVKNARMVIWTLGQMIADFALADQEASFFWVGALKDCEDPTIVNSNSAKVANVKKKGSQRHRVYALLTDLFMSHTILQPMRDDAKSLALLYSKKSKHSADDIVDEVYRHLPEEY